MRLLLFLILVTTTVGVRAASVEESRQVVTQAIGVYQNALDESDRDRRVQQFRRAESLFEKAIELRKQASPQSRLPADMYVNLGNAALGAERLGPAVLAFRRGLLMDPGHRRASQNLEYARTLLPTWVPVPEPEAESFGSLFDWLHELSVADWHGIAASLFLATMVLIAIHLRTGRSIWRNAAILAAVFWCSALVWPMVSDANDPGRIAVVVLSEVQARSADSMNAPVRFRDPLPGGTELLILESREGWFRVQLFDGRESWLQSSAVEAVDTGE